DAVAGVLLGIQDPATVPRARRCALGIADDLRTAHTLVACVLQPDDFSAQTAGTFAYLDAAAAGVVDPYPSRACRGDLAFNDAWFCRDRRGWGWHGGTRRRDRTRFRRGWRRSGRKLRRGHLDYFFARWRWR